MAIDFSSGIDSLDGHLKDKLYDYLSNLNENAKLDEGSKKSIFIPPGSKFKVQSHKHRLSFKQPVMLHWSQKAQQFTLGVYQLAATGSQAVSGSFFPSMLMVQICEETKKLKRKTSTTKENTRALLKVVLDEGSKQFIAQVAEFIRNKYLDKKKDAPLTHDIVKKILAYVEKVLTDSECLEAQKQETVKVVRTSLLKFVNEEYNCGKTSDKLYAEMCREFLKIEVELRFTVRKRLDEISKKNNKQKIYSTKLYCIQQNEEGHWEAYIVSRNLGDDLSKVKTIHSSTTQEQKATVAIKVSTQLLESYECLYNNAIIHRDIKRANIVKLKNGNGVHLIDFAYSKSGQPDDTWCGSPQNMDIFSKGNFLCKRSDLFSIGVVVLELLGYDVCSIANINKDLPIETILKKGQRNKKLFCKKLQRWYENQNQTTFKDLPKLPYVESLKLEEKERNEVYHYTYSALYFLMSPEKHKRNLLQAKYYLAGLQEYLNSLEKENKYCRFLLLFDQWKTNKRGFYTFTKEASKLAILKLFGVDEKHCKGSLKDLLGALVKHSVDAKKILISLMLQDPKNLHHVMEHHETVFLECLSQDRLVHALAGLLSTNLALFKSIIKKPCYHEIIAQCADHADIIDRVAEDKDLIRDLLTHNHPIDKFEPRYLQIAVTKCPELLASKPQMLTTAIQTYPDDVAQQAVLVTTTIEQSTYHKELLKSKKLLEKAVKNHSGLVLKHIPMADIYSKRKQLSSDANKTYIKEAFINRAQHYVNQRKLFHDLKKSDKCSKAMTAETYLHFLANYIMNTDWKKQDGSTNGYKTYDCYVKTKALPKSMWRIMTEINNGWLKVNKNSEPQGSKRRTLNRGELQKTLNNVIKIAKKADNSLAARFWGYNRTKQAKEFYRIVSNQKHTTTMKM